MHEPAARSTRHGATFQRRRSHRSRHCLPQSRRWSPTVDQSRVGRTPANESQSKGRVERVQVPVFCPLASWAIEGFLRAKLKSPRFFRKQVATATHAFAFVAANSQDFDFFCVAPFFPRYRPPSMHDALWSILRLYDFGRVRRPRLAKLPRSGHSPSLWPRRRLAAPCLLDGPNQ
jgi:hypothetical protein